MRAGILTFVLVLLAAVPAADAATTGSSVPGVDQGGRFRTLTLTGDAGASNVTTTLAPYGFIHVADPRYPLVAATGCRSVLASGYILTCDHPMNEPQVILHGSLGGGHDVLAVDQGSATSAVVDGGAGNDDLALAADAIATFTGGTGNDALTGGGHEDSLAGNAGNDRLTGGSGDDALGGGTGNDLLRGGPGEDGLAGGAGRNTLDGGAGFDHYTAAGRDLVKARDGGPDTIACRNRRATVRVDAIDMVSGRCAHIRRRGAARAVPVGDIGEDPNTFGVTTDLGDVLGTGVGCPADHKGACRGTLTISQSGHRLGRTKFKPLQPGRRRALTLHVGERVVGRVDERKPLTLRVTTRRKRGRDLVAVASAPAF